MNELQVQMLVATGVGALFVLLVLWFYGRLNAGTKRATASVLAGSVASLPDVQSGEVKIEGTAVSSGGEELLAPVQTKWRTPKRVLGYWLGAASDQTIAHGVSRTRLSTVFYEESRLGGFALRHGDQTVTVRGPALIVAETDSTDEVAREDLPEDLRRRMGAGDDSPSRLRIVQSVIEEGDPVFLWGSATPDEDDPKRIVLGPVGSQPVLVHVGTRESFVAKVRTLDRSAERSLLASPELGAFVEHLAQPKKP